MSLLARNVATEVLNARRTFPLPGSVRMARSRTFLFRRSIDMYSSFDKGVPRLGDEHPDDPEMNAYGRDPVWGMRRFLLWHFRRLIGFRVLYTTWPKAGEMASISAILP